MSIWLAIASRSTMQRGLWNDGCCKNCNPSAWLRRCRRGKAVDSLGMLELPRHPGYSTCCRCPCCMRHVAWTGGGSVCIPDHWTVKHRGFLHAMVHDPTTVATCKPEARWAISSRRTRSDGTPNRARTAAHASTLARLQIVTCGQALPLGSASGLWLGTVNSPEKQNARRCERRAFSSAAVFGGMAETKLALDTAPRSRKRSRCGFLFDIRFRLWHQSPHVER